jgi:hypothetical protein
MTRTEVLRVIASVGWVLAVALLATERRLIRRLRRAAAVSPATAVRLQVRSPITRFRLARLRRAEAVVAAGPERFYLDPAGYGRYRRARRRRALTVLAVALPLIVVLWWVMGGAAGGEASVR